MAMKFYNVEKVSEILGISSVEVNAMRERQELHGYRDGANWKFKADDVDRLATERAAVVPAPMEIPGDDEDVLLSEVELGQSDPSTSGTILGPPPSDALKSSLSGFEDLDLSMPDSGLDMSGLDLSSVSKVTGASELDLHVGDLDDDDLVLGASSGGTNGGTGTGSGSSGSDLTIGGDSGISLLDPADSGLSLEEPLDLAAGSGQGSLALGDDQVLADSAVASSAPTDLASDSDFMLTPMDESGESEDSSSQVIALDEEDSSGELIGVAPMLDGDISGTFAPAAGLGDAVASDSLPLGIPTPGISVATSAPVGDYGVAQAQGGVAVLPEAPYTTLNIVGLAFCTIVLLLVGMMLYDLMRNMWSWNQPSAVNSWLMDLILGR